MDGLPPGYVDPHDVNRVAAVLDAVLDGSGVGGLLDLLARIPGVRVDPGSAKGFLRAAVPPSTWLGTEHQLVLRGGPARGEQVLVHQHVVGGITLSRDTLPPSRVPGVVARLLSITVRDAGSDEEASAALTAVRELFGPG